MSKHTTPAHFFPSSQPFPTDLVFNHYRAGVLDGGALFCHWRPTVILCLIAPAQIKLGYIDPRLNGACSMKQWTQITEPCGPQRKGRQVDITYLR